jgi:hypothetical protein
MTESEARAIWWDQGEGRGAGVGIRADVDASEQDRQAMFSKPAMP